MLLTNMLSVGRTANTEIGQDPLGMEQCNLVLCYTQSQLHKLFVQPLQTVLVFSQAVVELQPSLFLQAASSKNSVILLDLAANLRHPSTWSLILRHQWEGRWQKMRYSIKRLLAPSHSLRCSDLQTSSPTFLQGPSSACAGSLDCMRGAPMSACAEPLY